MKNQKKTLNILLWIARIWGTLILAFVLFFLFAGIFGNEESGEGLETASDIITFSCFPISTVIGLSVAWKWESWGGLITIGGMVGLFILRPDLIFNLFYAAVLVSGLLFLIYRYLSRGQLEKG